MKTAAFEMQAIATTPINVWTSRRTSPILDKRKDLSSVGQESDKMQTAFIAKAISVILACSILALFLVPTGFANRTASAENASVSSTSRHTASCNSSLDSFTVFPQTKLNKNQKGSVSGFEVHLSNADGMCSVMVYSTHHEAGNTNLGDPPDRIDGGYTFR